MDFQGLGPPPHPLPMMKPKSQARRQNGPLPRIPEWEFAGVSRALDIWSRLEDPNGNPHVAEDIFFEEHATKYARHGGGGLFCVESHRARDFTYANRVARAAWGEISTLEKYAHGGTTGGEFPDALVRHRQTQ